MKEFLAQITSLSWWFGVVIVGLLINLAASYIKPKIDAIHENISKNARNKNEKKRKAWDEEVKHLAENDSYQADFSSKLSHVYLESIFIMLMGIAIFLMSISLGKFYPEVETHANMPETLWRKAKWSTRQPDCLNPKGEFPAVA